MRLCLDFLSNWICESDKLVSPSAFCHLIYAELLAMLGLPLKVLNAKKMILDLIALQQHIVCGYVLTSFEYLQIKSRMGLTQFGVNPIHLHLSMRFPLYNP